MKNPTMTDYGNAGVVLKRKLIFGKGANNVLKQKKWNIRIAVRNLLFTTGGFMVWFAFYKLLEYDIDKLY
jgi:hypothetical protein